MAYIKLNVKYPVYDGMPITFEAPCDCTAADGVAVGSQNFSFADAHGAILTGVGNLFMKGALVKVILDTSKKVAYIQNADTNSYLEGKAAKGTLVTNADATTVKPVPATAAPYAKVTEIGGKTRKCTNWIPRPYVFEKAGRTENGLSVTVRDDGTIVLNGTLGGTAWEWLPIAQWREDITDETDTGVSFPGKGRTFTFSGMIDGGSEQTYMLRCVGGTDAYYLYNSDEYAVWRNVDYTFCTVNLMIAPGVTFNNVEFRPMINEGETPLPYEPYFSGLRSAPVTEVESIGANLYSGGDLSFTQAATVTLEKPLEAGTYTIGCVCTSTVVDTKPIATFIGVDGKSVKSISFSRTARDTVTVTLSSPVSQIRFCAGNSYNGSAGYSATYTDIMINEGSTALPYTPYLHRTISIPAAVRALGGYGAGNPDDVSEYNAIIWDGSGKCFYSHKGDITDGAWVALTTPTVTDISDIFPADNLLPVEGGGTVTFVNEYGYDVPSRVVFYEDSNEIVGAKQFVGELVGTAHRAKRAEMDALGNPIDAYYYPRYAKLIDSSYDLNTLYTPGVYRYVTGNSPANAPFDGYAAFVEVFGDNYSVIQRVQRYGVAGSVCQRRVRTDGTVEVGAWGYFVMSTSPVTPTAE